MRATALALFLGSILLGVVLRADGVKPPADGTAPLPGETVLLPELRGVITVPRATGSAAVPPGFAGIDVSRTPVLAAPAFTEVLGVFLGKPMSFGSLDRLCIGLRTALRLTGQPFVSVYAPPQDVTDGVIRLVVQPATLEGELQVEGAKRRPAEFYRAIMPLKPGDEIDAAAVQAGVDRLNRNPYRRVVIVAEPGARAGTTRLVLRAQEARPWQVTAGYNNSGTAVTDENRVTAAWSWGDAFGRGDTLGYSLSADPSFRHAVSHSANYGTIFDLGHSLTVFGSYSTIVSELPEPLTQEGTSWQAGVRFGVPLKQSRGGWERSLNFSADFKYSDNNLEFAAIPITNNVTHVAQLGVTLSTSRRTGTRGLSLSASVYASPGGLTDRHADPAYEAARPGAKAAYFYGRLDGQFSQRLPYGFAWSASASLQGASGALLGTEQLNGGGSSAVRGYGESSAFGDEGAVITTELHLPALSPIKGRDQMDAFGFLDAAVLHNLGPGSDTTKLASAGLGLNYRFGRYFSLRAAYGWQLQELPNIARGSAHGHLGAGFTF